MLNTPFLQQFVPQADYDRSALYQFASEYGKTVFTYDLLKNRYEVLSQYLNDSAKNIPYEDLRMEMKKIHNEKKQLRTLLHVYNDELKAKERELIAEKKHLEVKDSINFLALSCDIVLSSLKAI